MTYSVLADGTITSAEGYRASGVHAGLKADGARDLALVYSLRPCVAAAMFTTSSIKGAPVLFDQALLARKRDQIRAVLINSQIANVGLGRKGFEVAVECARLAAEKLEIPPDSVLLMSTGAVGLALPMEHMRNGIELAVSQLESGSGQQAALAMLTSDQQPKQQAVRVPLRGEHDVTIGGIAKGGSRVQPNLATTLCLLTTDAALPAPLLARSLRQAVEQSFHCITVDGDMSPNDTVILLANGAAEAPPISGASSWEYGIWQEALNALTRNLARMVVDEAGQRPLITLEVSGAQTSEEARQAGLCVARSPGVRRGWEQGWIDWTAIVAALGASGAQAAAEHLELQVGEQLIATAGQLRPDAPASLPGWRQEHEIVLRLALNVGEGKATIWTRT